jgi:hypothetical protein
MITITDLKYTIETMNSNLAMAGANKRLTVQKHGSRYVVQCFQRLGSDEQRSRFIDNVVTGTARECIVGAEAYAWKHACMVTLDNKALVKAESALLREENTRLNARVAELESALEDERYHINEMAG